MGTKYTIEVEDKPFELLSEDGFTSEKLFRVKGFNSLVFDWNGLNMLTPYTEPDLEQVKADAYNDGYKAGREAEKVRQPDLEQVREEANNTGYKIGYEKGYRDGVNTIGDAEDKIRKEAYEQGQEDLRKSCVPKDEEAYGIGYNEGFQRGLDLAWEAAKKIKNMSCYSRNEIFGTEFSDRVFERNTPSEAIEKIRQYEQRQEEQIQVGDEVESTFGKGVVVKVEKEHVSYIYNDGSWGYNPFREVTKTGRHFDEIAAVLEKMREGQEQ